MTTIAVRELRDNLSKVLRDVEAGETLTVTVDRRPVAELRPVSAKPTWVTAEEFRARFDGRLADPALLDELDELLPDTIDDL